MFHPATSFVGIDLNPIISSARDAYTSDYIAKSGNEEFTQQVRRNVVSLAQGILISTPILVLVKRYTNSDAIGAHAIADPLFGLGEEPLTSNTLGLFDPDVAQEIVWAFIWAHGGTLVQATWDDLTPEVIEVIAQGSSLLPLEWKSTPTEHEVVILTTTDVLDRAQAILDQAVDRWAAEQVTT